MNAEMNVQVSQVGHPRKHVKGYVRYLKHLYILEATFHEWQSIKREMGLSSDDEVAKYLLDCRKTVMANRSWDNCQQTDLGITVSKPILG